MEIVRSANILKALIWTFTVPIAVVGVAAACWGAVRMPLGERGLFVCGGTFFALVSSVVASIPGWISRSSRLLFAAWLFESLMLAAAVITWCAKDVAAIGFPIIGVR